MKSSGKDNGPKYSEAVLAFLEKAKQDAKSGPRMLTPSERTALQLHARETSAWLRAEIKARKEARDL